MDKENSESANMKRRRKILFLTPRFIYPLIGGDRLKPYNLIKHLAKYHDLTLVSFYQGEAPSKKYVEAITGLGAKLEYLRLNPVKAGVETILRLPFRYPLEISYYYQADYRRIVDKLIEDNDFDIAFAFFMRTAEYLKNKNIKKVLIAEDCRTLYQKRSSEESDNLVQKSVRSWEYFKLKKYEPEIVNHFDITTLVTREDIEAMKGQNSDAVYRLLTNGTDIYSYTTPENNSNRKDILFSGKLDIWANVLMIRQIVGKIMPLVHEKLPETRLNLVGANPTPAVEALVKENDYISLHRNVPEMIPFLQEAALFLHPHSGGSGIQNKLLEAMACGCPVVTTPTGNQGIYGEHGKHLMLGENSVEMANHAIDILTNKELADSISANGRELMVNTHSWEAVWDALDDIMQEIDPR